MNIYTKGTALAAAAVFALATAAPAMADHDTTGFELSIDGLTVYIDCETFGGIRGALSIDPSVGAPFVKFGSDGKGGYGPDDGRDREGLNGKLDEVHNKYLHADPPKVCDAAQKLDDFNAKVKQLVYGNTADKLKIWNVNEDQDAIKCLIEGSAAYAQKLREGESCGDSGGSKPGGKGPKNR